ncbi:MAG: aspartate carbamoyltransferase [Acidobacteria bacterium]|nr:aspartate carbamoyltransferase [Acidobacteriota bacterium]
MKERTFRQDHLLGIEHLSVDDIETILETAEAFIEVSSRDVKKVPALKGKTVVNLFFENSTRTRSSFEIAAKRLSADLINFNSSVSSLKKGETLKDTVLTLEAMNPHIIVIRHSASGSPHYLTTFARSSIVNAGDGFHEHPTQALLDALTIQIGPPSLVPVEFEKLGATVSYDMRGGVKNADVVMMLRVQAERGASNYFPSIREYRNRFAISRELFALASKRAILMHPGPINRDVEIETSMADSEQSVILQQVTNGIAVRMAVLYLLKGEVHETLN